MATIKMDGTSRLFVLMKAYCEKKEYEIPVTELEFAKKTHKRKWRLDCAWPKLMLAMEFMGGVWAPKGGKGGYHVRGGGYTKDCEKACHLAILGWRYMPVTTQQFRKGLAFKWLDEFMEKNNA